MTAPDSLSPLRPSDPRQLGAFRVQARLGSGGQGVVYLGTDPRGQPVAIKVLREELADAGARERLGREAATAVRVAPFCTARLIEAQLSEEPYFLVSEYVPGLSLHDVLARTGRLTGSALHRLAIGTATALTAIHRAGIIHRDFKPSNVLISPDGPRVIDFGIARVLDSAALTSSGVLGTPAYMAPEQLNGQRVDAKVDVFAWACTMAFAATGRSPFAAETMAAVIYRILHAAPELGEVEPPLRELLGECLAPDPADRPSSETILLRLIDLHGSAPPDQTSLLADGARIAAPGWTGRPDHRSRPRCPRTGRRPPQAPRSWPGHPPTLHGPPVPTGPPAAPRRSRVGRVLLAGVAGVAVIGLLISPAVRGGSGTTGGDPSATSFASTTEETPTEDPTTTAAADPSVIPAEYVGTWRGLVSQTGPQTSQYHVDIVITEGSTSATVSYQEPKCSGYQEYQQTDDSGALRLREVITTGTENCASEIPVVLKLNPATSTIEFSFDDASGNHGQAVLDKVAT